MREKWKLLVGGTLVVIGLVAEIGSVAMGTPFDGSFYMIITGVVLVVWHYISEKRRKRDDNW